MGKSATAAVAALQLRRRFTDGQIYAELGGPEQPRDPQDVIAEVLQSVGVAAETIPVAGPARAAMYRSVLANRRVLVIADDAAYAAQIRPLLPAAGGAAVLVTSRSPLTGLIGARQVRLQQLGPEEAMTLLELAAGPARIGAEPEAACEIVAACAGMPLAIRLAGAVLAARPGLKLATLARDCSGARTLDALGAEDSSVRAAIGRSYSALPPAARGAFSLAASYAADEIPAWALTDLADGDDRIAGKLVSVGLLQPADAETSGQAFCMHPLVRTFGRERAADFAAGADEADWRPARGA
jgi:NB-ARC domain